MTSTAANANQTLLREAIARNAGVVLSLPSAGILRHHKSRFLADAGDGFWLESVPAERPLVEELINTKKPVGVSFKSGNNKVVLTTPINFRDADYAINAETIVEAILLPFPEVVKAIQRRGNYRVQVPAESELTIKMWRIPEHAYIGDRPMAAQSLDATLRDISLGGAGVTLLGKNGEPPKVSTEDRLRIELNFKGNTLLLEGRMRHPAKPDAKGPVRAGLQFKKLEDGIEGRQKLAAITKIVGELHREEVRRARLGL